MKFSFIIALLLIVSCPLVSAKSNAKDTPYKTASSSDKKFIITHKPTTNTLIIQDAKNLNELKVIPVVDKKKKSSLVSGLHDASARNSFIVTLKDSPEIWEINYQNPPPSGFGTWVHDYRKDSGEATNTLFPIRRLRFDKSVDNFFLDKDYVKVISVSCKGNIQIIDLDLGRKIAGFNIFDQKPEGIIENKILGLNRSYIKKTFQRAAEFRLKNCFS